MPTTKEFGPRGGSATGNITRSSRRASAFVGARHEDHYTPLDQPPGSTQIRLADGVPLFDTGALAPDVTLQKATYWILSVDAGLKYRGLFLQAEYSAAGSMTFRETARCRSADPRSQLLRASVGLPIPKWWELYAGTSMVFGDRAAGFATNYEVSAAPMSTPPRSATFASTDIIYVDHSSAGGTFGYYSQARRARSSPSPPASSSEASMNQEPSSSFVSRQHPRSSAAVQ